MRTDENGKLSSLPAPEYRDHEFNGWFTAKTGGSQVSSSTIFDRDTTIYAHWTSKSIQPVDPDPTGFTVTFNANGGSCSVSTMTADSAGKISYLPTATRQGYSFTGWFTASSGGSRIDQSAVFDENTIAYAQWMQEYTVTFDANGGSCSVGAVQTVNGKISSLPVPTYRDHDFSGWYTSVSGGEKVTSSYGFFKNMTVYAHWAAQPVTPVDPNQPDIISYTVILDANGGSCSISELATDLNGRVSSLPTPVFSGYDFTGWYTSTSEGTVVNVDTVFKQNTTVYAHWNKTTVEPKPDDDVDPEIPDKADNGKDPSFPVTNIIAGCGVVILAILCYMIYSRPKD